MLHVLAQFFVVIYIGYAVSICYNDLQSIIPLILTLLAFIPGILFNYYVPTNVTSIISSIAKSCLVIIFLTIF